MANIPVDGIIKQFQRMYKEHWQYVWGAAREGCVDCSGAFVWAYQQYHKSIAHGSNAIARSYVREVLPISECKPGMAVFKYRSPGDAGYSLPDKYKNGADKRDFYHIGLADTDPRYILNAQSTKTGFARSPVKNGWTACGYLKAVDYGEEKPMEKMIVTSPNGKKVRVRSAPGQTAPIIDYLQVGTSVMAEPELNGWRKITCSQVSGYMMDEFLKPQTATTSTDLGGGTAEQPAFVKTLTTDEYNTVCACRDEALAIYERLKEIVGVG